MFYSGAATVTDGVDVPRPAAPHPGRSNRARAGIALVAITGAVLAWHAVGLATFALTAPAVGVWLVGARRARDAARVSAVHDEARSSVTVMLETLAMRDGWTARHSAAVARYARLIAAAAGLSAREQELVHTAGLLHDIGRLGFPDHLLGPAPPDQGDWNVIRTHPERGAVLVESVPGYAEVAEIVRCHHERPDGRGYPRRLTGAEIPALAQIIAVAECFDVMTGGDSYRTPMSFHSALAELRRVAGSQLDARYVETFADVLMSARVALRDDEDRDRGIASAHVSPARAGRALMPQTRHERASQHTSLPKKKRSIARAGSSPTSAAARSGSKNELGHFIDSDTISGPKHQESPAPDRK